MLKSAAGRNAGKRPSNQTLQTDQEVVANTCKRRKQISETMHTEISLESIGSRSVLGPVDQEVLDIQVKADCASHLNTNVSSMEEAKTVSNGKVSGVFFI